MPPGCYLSAPKFPIGRYNADGTLDSSFGDGGLSVIVVGGGDVARAVAIQPSGKIIVAGSSTSNGMGAFALIRIHVGRPGLAAGQTTPVRIPFGTSGIEPPLTEAIAERGRLFQPIAPDARQPPRLPTPVTSFQNDRK